MPSNFEVVEGPFEHKRYKDAAVRITISGQRQLWHTRTVGEICLSPEKNGPSTTYRRKAGQHAGFESFLDQLYQRLEPMLTTILANPEIEAGSLVS
jgi:hypothetical protein